MHSKWEELDEQYHTKNCLRNPRHLEKFYKSIKSVLKYLKSDCEKEVAFLLYYSRRQDKLVQERMDFRIIRSAK